MSDQIWSESEVSSPVNTTTTDAKRDDINSSIIAQGNASKSQPIINDTSPLTSTTSALRHNIATKGRNSYYYAWDKQEVKGEYSPVLVNSTGADTTKKQTRTILNYAWADFKKSAKVYISNTLFNDDINAENIEENLIFEAKSRGFDLKLNLKNEILRLRIDGLYENIIPDESKWQLKADKLILILAKRDITQKWYRLKKEK